MTSSVQAQIIASGVVMPSCIISATTPPVLMENSLPASSLASGPTGSGSVTVKCNSSTSVLTLTPGSHIIPTQTPVATVGFQFAGGGTGIYTSVTSGTITPAATDVTSSLGDTAKISAVVLAAPGKLLKVGSYTLYINAAVTP
jgi:hypothetical protein